MTAQQLKKLTSYARNYQIQLTHKRTGYFKHEVIIGGQPYTDPNQVIELLDTLHTNQSAKKA